MRRRGQASWYNESKRFFSFFGLALHPENKKSVKCEIKSPLPLLAYRVYKFGRLLLRLLIHVGRGGEVDWYKVVMNGEGNEAPKSVF